MPKNKEYMKISLKKRILLHYLLIVRSTTFILCELKKKISFTEILSDSTFQFEDYYFLFIAILNSSIALNHPALVYIFRADTPRQFETELRSEYLTDSISSVSKFLTRSAAYRVRLKWWYNLGGDSLRQSKSKVQNKVFSYGI